MSAHQMQHESAAGRKPARTNAERSRLYRERRRKGLRVIEVQIFSAEIDALIRAGYLDASLRDDASAVEAGIEKALERALRPWRKE